MSVTPQSNVTIDGSFLGSPASARFESEVSGTFNTVKLNRVGALLVLELKRKLRIQPEESLIQLGVSPTIGPQTLVEDSVAAGVKGRQIYSCSNARPVLDDARHPLLGDGQGSDATIFFSPAHYPTSGLAYHQKRPIPAGWRRDELLFHEMVHAVRAMAAVRNCTIAAPGFDNKEEVWSIMTTNIYSSAWNRPLRRNHHGHMTMAAAEASAYFQQFEAMIGHMCRDLPRFTRAVSQIAYITFNPFRDYYKVHP